MKRFFSEPLLHFIVLGLALFALYSLRERFPRSERDTIVVTPGRIETLVTTFAAVWQRPPTVEELDGLIENYVVEEMLSREAIKLGLDRNDTVIRRRLRQKMEFITEDIAAMNEPSDDDLAKYLRDNPKKFETDPYYSFRHVFLANDPADASQADAVALLAKLNASGDVDASSLGDRLMLPHEFIHEPRNRISAQFGDAFADRLDSVPLGVWSGPIESGYGGHLVLIMEKTPARVPPLEEARDEVRRELVNERREEAHKRAIEGLRMRYDVVIEPPDDPSAGQGGVQK